MVQLGRSEGSDVEMGRVVVLPSFSSLLSFYEHEVTCERRMGVDSIAVSLFGNMTVEPGEIHIITKEYQNKRSK